LECEYLPFPHVYREHARKRAITAGVRRRPTEEWNLAVRADHRGRVFENSLEIVFVDGVEYPATASLFGNPQCRFSSVLNCGFEAAPLSSDLSKVFARKLAIPVTARNDDVFRISAATFKPEKSNGFHFDLCANRWILETIPQVVARALERPCGQERCLDARGRCRTR